MSQIASSTLSGDPNQDYLDWLSSNQGGLGNGMVDGGYIQQPTPGVVSTNPDGSARVNGGSTSLGITDPGQGTNKTSQNAPYGLDHYGNPLPPPGPGNFAVTGSVSYDNSGNLLTSSAKPAAAAAPQVNKTGNAQADWQSFVQSKGYTGTQARTNMAQLVDEFNRTYGYSAKAGNPNASGLTDTVDFGNGLIDLVHGGDDAWQWYDTANDSQNGGGGSNPNFAPTQTTPFVAGARTAQAPQSIWDANDPGSQQYQALLDRLKGISTGTTSEFSNPNLQINPLTDAIIKPQVDAFDAAQQRSSRRYLSAAAERQGSNANIGAETRHAAEASGQATAQYQASLAKEELGARRQEIQSALNGEMGMLTARQQSKLQEELASINSVEQQYEWDSGLAEKAYEFDSNNQYRNSPLAYL